MSARDVATANRIWQAMVSVVMHSRDDWRLKVTAASGLPFSRVRALRRLERGPRTLGDLAAALGTDAPAATVAVNDLEARGLVERKPHPEDRRAKLVLLTPAGRKVLAKVVSVTDEAPPALAALAKADLARLERALDAMRKAE